MKKLREFFIKNLSNSIDFLDCPSNDKWPIHSIVDKDFNLTLLFPYKLSWNFERKSEYDNISNIWKIMFQVSNIIGRQFLNLSNDDIYPIEPLYTKEGP